MGFLEPPATIAAVHGVLGDHHEYFVLEDEDENVITCLDADGMRRPRRIRRAEMRSVVVHSRKHAGGMHPDSSLASIAPSSAHSSVRLETGRYCSFSAQSMQGVLVPQQVLLKRMRVR